MGGVVRSDTLDQVLESLASSGPGGRGAAALHAAVGVALLARVRGSGPGAEELQEAARRFAGAEAADPVGAARHAVRVIELAERALDLAETLRTGDRVLVSDVAAAAEALRAAVGTARVEVEVHLAGITDPVVREELLLAIDPVDDVVLRAAKVTAVVREQLLR
ncbi:cyclodeaminase/cyclohydrolase family protein [Actinomycetospora aeridis]|uniref:Cyclodeaminase/cyclohydrolase family protein n=1 Tax=Actinomycetospora aeridis TaxID=3129231 RepID=A0ABU8N080_9PSEU